MLKVNFRHVNGFFARFAASVFVGEKGVFNAKWEEFCTFQTIYETVHLFCAGWQTSVIPFRVLESKQDKSF